MTTKKEKWFDLPIWCCLGQVANNIARHLEIGNLRVEVGSAEELPYRDKEFEGAWLFGFLFLLNRRILLSEVNGILQRGAKGFRDALNGPGKIVQKLCLSLKKGGRNPLISSVGVAGNR